MLLFCPKCQSTSIGIKNKFCEQCGNKMTEMPKCRCCGEKIWPSHKFCRSCGKSRQEALSTFPTHSDFWKNYKKFIREYFF